jgi:peptidoglycan/LPS O-acetylase OafA/YrhL
MYQHLPSPVKFREDINGLRAWAVIAVLLFHFSLIGLPGGFAGVDVFFVISGYLMTAIIVGAYEKGNFSIWKFYMARARRILPALLVVIAALLALGWFWLPTPDYQTLGAESAYGMSFLSNIYYWRSAGYFDTAAEEKWLLHTWSLAVEAQFYVLYPIFIALVWKFWKSLKAITIVVLTLFIASLVLNLVVTGWAPSGAFYLLPTRGWELAAGGLVYLIAKQGLASESLKNNGYWSGWILVVASFFFITEHLVWPGYWAILPVLGTSLIILGQRETCALTDNAVAQWLGDRSYSLYLWHWPLVVALYFANLQNEWSWVIGAFALSLILAHLSYKFIETPTRQYLSQAKLFKEILVIASVGAVIGLSAVSIRLFSFDGRMPEKIEIASNESKNKDPNRAKCFDIASDTSPGCIYPLNYTGELGALLLGDSHAASSITALASAGWQSNKVSKFYGRSGCPTIRGLHRTTLNCYDFNKWLLKEIDNKFKNIPVILVNRTNVYLKGHNEKPPTQIAYFDLPVPKLGDKDFKQQFQTSLIETACSIQKKNPVYLMRPIPEIGIDVPKILSKNMIFDRDSGDIKITLEEYHQRNKLVWEAQDKAAEQCGVKILNPLPYLCDDKYCYGSKNGRPLYYDGDHLSEYGNKFLVPMFEEVFKSSPKN